MDKKLEQNEENVFPRCDVLDRAEERALKKLKLNRLSVRTQLRVGAPMYGVPPSHSE